MGLAGGVAASADGCLCWKVGWIVDLDDELLYSWLSQACLQLAINRGPCQMELMFFFAL